MIGKVSTFGGPNDKGMKPGEGLALYEHHEADLRPDLFLPRSYEASFGTSQRLRPDALYVAVRFDYGKRDEARLVPWRLRNLKNGKWIIASLVDWGPRADTGRFFDISTMAAHLLDIDTDDYIDGTPILWNEKQNRLETKS